MKMKSGKRICTHMFYVCCSKLSQNYEIFYVVMKNIFKRSLLFQSSHIKEAKAKMFSVLFLHFIWFQKCHCQTYGLSIKSYHNYFLIALKLLPASIIIKPENRKNPFGPDPENLIPKFMDTEEKLYFS